MKRTKLISGILAIAMLLTMAASISAFADATPVSGTDAVTQYGNKHVIYDENYFKSNVGTAFSVNTVEVNKESVAAGKVEWNDTTGRIKLTSEKGNMVTTVKAIPANLINYTVQADLYLTAGASKKFGMGINSNETWAKSTYFQIQAGTKAAYLNNSSSSASPWIALDLANKYEVGEKITVRVEISDTYAFFTVYHNDAKYTYATTKFYDADKGIALSDLGYAFGTGAPFFNQHNGATLEVDNLTVWAGTDIDEPVSSNPTDTPDTPTAMVYYPDGTVIFSENDISAEGADMSKLFSNNASDPEKYNISWNAESGRLRIDATKNQVVTDIKAVPANLGYYTVSADLYLVENNTGTADNAIFGMGINSASVWSRSSYLQCNVKGGQTSYWFNNYNSSGTNGSGSASLPDQGDYELGTTKVSVTIQVSDKAVLVTLNGNFLTTFKLEDLAYEIGTGSPFFFQRGNTVIEIDNLVVYAGITAPDYEKTLANQTALSAPDIKTDSGDDGNGGNNGGFMDEGEDEGEDNGQTATPPTDTSSDTKTDDASADTSADTAAEDKGGCKSSMGIGMFGAVIMAGAAVAVGKRKRK